MSIRANVIIAAFNKQAQKPSGVQIKLWQNITYPNL